VVHELSLYLNRDFPSHSALGQPSFMSPYHSRTERKTNTLEPHLPHKLVKKQINVKTPTSPPYLYQVMLDEYNHVIESELHYHTDTSRTSSGFVVGTLIIISSHFVLHRYSRYLRLEGRRLSRTSQVLRYSELGTHSIMISASTVFCPK